MDARDLNPAALGARPTPPIQAEAEPTPALQMTDVSIGSMYDPGRTVFAEVNWTVVPGEFWAIGGLHRSGKSDFMAAAAGLVRPLAGRYRVFGRDLSTGFRHELLEVRLRLGLVFDGGRLLNDLSVLENVALPLRYHRRLGEAEAARRTERLIEITGLGQWASRMPSSLGRNWQQRVGLARALALQPEILLLDSPLSGLDPRDALWWLEFLRQLSAGHAAMDGRPMTLVVSGDDLRPWKGLARRFAVLRGQRFVPLHGEPEAIARDDLMQHLLGGGIGPFVS
jgi:ABC-type transporter Mla maintaining outer membrane lipid asymmetry ATPase subunit MlaF